MPTARMSDIAKMAGVSTSAVSLALNGRDGVSPETRRRIAEIAASLGWYPNAAARALTGRRVNAIGVVLTRPPQYLGREPFFMSFLAGLQAGLTGVDGSVLMHITTSVEEEVATYRRWSAEKRVDGLVLLDLQVNDDRPRIVTELDLPAVVVGSPQYAGGLPAVWTDDDSAIRAAVTYLASQGHSRLARITDHSRMAHTSIRTRAFLSACHDLDLPTPAVVEIDPSNGGTQEAIEAVLRRPNRPTGLLFDVDLMAIAALNVARSLGLAVPADLSIITYDDSLLCEATQPAITALNHDVHAYGAHAARMLLNVLDGEPQPDELDALPQLIVRESSGARGTPTP